MKDFLSMYLAERPLFLALIRAKEMWLWQKHLPLKKPVADVGIGDGFFAKITFKKIDIGLDLPDSRMNEAKRVGVYDRIIEFDGRKIPLKNGSVNTVVSNCVLEHAEDLSALLTEIYRILKTKGVFITTVMAKPWEENLVGSIIFGNSYKSWMRIKQVHLNLLSYQQWKQVFIKSGFTVRENIGYLTPEACKWLDICHYLSLPSLISYKLTGKWTFIPNLFPVRLIEKIFEKNCDSEESGAIFWVLIK